MSFTTVALGLFLLVLIALGFVNRARLRGAYVAVRDGLGTLMYGRIRENPRRYMEEFLVRRLEPLFQRTKEAIGRARVQHERAGVALADAATAFPRRPSATRIIRLAIVGVCLTVVAVAAASLDWSLLKTFTGQAWLATVLTMVIVTAPVGLAWLGEALANRSPGRAVSEAGDPRRVWSTPTFGTAIIGLGCGYIVLATGVGFLGSTRADYAYETAVAQEESAYVELTNRIHASWDEPVNDATLHQTQALNDPSATREVRVYWNQTVKDRERDRDAEVKAAEDNHTATTETLREDRRSAMYKYVGFALSTSVLECGFAYGAKPVIGLVWLMIARNNERKAADKLARAMAAQSQAMARLWARLGRRIARAVGDLDGYLSFRREHTDGAPPADDGAGAILPPGGGGAGLAEGPPGTEGPVILDRDPTRPARSAPEPPADDPPDMDLDDGPTPGFDEA
jgi:hypothetical protein